VKEVPLHWTRSTLSQVADWGSGGTPTAGNADYYDGDIPWAVIGDLNDGMVADTQQRITDLGLRSSSAKLVPADAVLVAMYGSIGKLGISAKPMATNQAIAFAKCSPRVLPKFLFYFLLSQRAQLTRAGKGATQKNISQSILRPWPIAYPPSEEQRRIIDQLEDHLSRLDAAQGMVKTGVARVEALRISALRRFLNELREGNAPELMLASVAETRLGKMLDSKRATGTDTPYLRNINVRWGTVDLVDVKSVPLSESERQNLALQPGDLLVCEGGEPGRCAVWPGSAELMTFQKALHRVRVDPARLTAEYAAAVLEAVVRSGELDSSFTGTTIKHLPQERLRALRLPVPDRDEQRNAVAGLRSLDEYAGRLVRQLRRLETQSAALRRALLEAAFSGRLTGRGSTDNKIVEEMAEVAS
jgi:restriction endonuclease S subunit